MNPTRRDVLRTIGLVAAAPVIARAADEPDPLAPWRGAKVRPVTAQGGRHTIHTYYLTRPESPDPGGSRVLFYASTTPEGEHGDLIVMDRASGAETVVARGIDTEDAHRAACQQWISGGRRVAYHDVKAGRWSVHVVDLDTGTDRKIAEDRQLCFGRAVDDLLPIYGCHWNPGEHRDLELLNAASGEVTTALTIGDVEKKHGPWLTKQFGGRATSIFFPNISPDGTRAFFKMSAPAPGSGGPATNFKSSRASDRQGLFVYDLRTRALVFMHEKWGHPAWFPDSAKIIDIGATYFDIDHGGKAVRLAGLPKMGASHQAVSPDGKTFVMDGPLGPLAQQPDQWGVVVCDIRGERYEVVHRFDNSRGAKTWRHNHPHPIFSADGRRIYFNVNAGPWTQFHVAEATTQS